LRVSRLEMSMRRRDSQESEPFDKVLRALVARIVTFARKRNAWAAERNLIDETRPGTLNATANLRLGFRSINSKANSKANCRPESFRHGSDGVAGYPHYTNCSYLDTREW
jgi:hypothetical protein